MVTIPIFLYVTLHNIERGFIKLPVKLRPAGDFARRHHLDILLFWYLVLAFFIIKHFWYYFGSFLN
jgi:hypothetical protein